MFLIWSWGFWVPPERMLILPGPQPQRDSISYRSVKTGALLIAQIHGYLLGLKSIKTLIVGLQKI
jgi:hypothetical protein